ncbi:MAG: glucose-6-phosphate isomerase, partial [Planctomycetes bacterium]|nr:glucose-6-phosphate isomerase [Planctomycetota bacterium]
MSAPADARILLDDPFVELDLLDAGIDPAGMDALRPRLLAALEAMAALEGGAIANPSEQRMVGHYWLRAPGLAPSDELSVSIADTLAAVEKFAAGVRSGDIGPRDGGRLDKLLLCGIGGSSLGPMLLADCLADPGDPMRFFALDNTDPDGIARTLAEVGDLASALVLVVSKSGGTPETRNGMLEVRAACERAGVDFATRAVAVTGQGSALFEQARREKWLATFPMWDWVGGRTSVCSAVGMLPAALLGFDTRGFLAGAAAMDDRTRDRDPGANPAAALAAFWHLEGGGLGTRDMVVLPYADRLLLLSRYLQQLVMESLGKREDRMGNVVHQGLAVYGNKGSTDQHAYVQQLRDGLHNFFVMFVRVLENGGGTAVDDGVVTGDFLNGFYLGTRRALAEGGRHSATLHVRSADARTLGALIALFERAVGVYAELVDVNAYDQPGVEAGKKAASEALALQARVVGALGA